MNPLKTAETNVQKARARLDDLTADTARFKVALEDSEGTERGLRKDRAEVAQIAEARNRSAAARELLTDAEGEVANIRAILEQLERTLARERIVAGMETSAREGGKQKAALRAELDGLAELLRPHLARIAEMHGNLEASVFAYNEGGRALVRGYDGLTGHRAWENGSSERRELESDLEARGASVEAVARPLQPPQDLAGRIVWESLQQHLATERRRVEHAKQQAAAAERNRRAAHEERAAMVAEFFIPARYARDAERALEDALVSPLGSRRVETREPGQSKTLELLQIGIRQTEREKARFALAAALPSEVEVRILDAPGAYAD